MAFGFLPPAGTSTTHESATSTSDESTVPHFIYALALSGTQKRQAAADKLASSQGRVICVLRTRSAAFHYLSPV